MIEYPFCNYQHQPGCICGRTILELMQKTARCVELLKKLADDEECRLDHHGACQTHRLENPCTVAEVRNFLKEGK